MSMQHVFPWGAAAHICGAAAGPRGTPVHTRSGVQHAIPGVLGASQGTVVIQARSTWLTAGAWLRPARLQFWVTHAAAT